jgi:hypothetical protein
MDGSSFDAHLLSELDEDKYAVGPRRQKGKRKAHSSNSASNNNGSGIKPWRDFHYSEYTSLGNLWRGGGDIMGRDHLIDDPISHTYR